jgi:hypothetical protein
MNKSVRLQAQLLVLAFFVAVGLGSYAYMLHSDLTATNAAIARVQDEAAKLQAEAQKAEAESKSGKDVVAQCRMETEGLRGQLEAALAAPPAPAKGKARTRS